jgi:hypothetical protein
MFIAFQKRTTLETFGLSLFQLIRGHDVRFLETFE